MDNKEAVKRLLLLLGRYKKTIVVIVGCLLVSTGLNLCVPLISRRIMDDGFIGGNKKLLIELVLVSMVIYTINSLIDIVKEKKRVDISAKIQYFLSEQSFSHLMKLRVNYFNNTNYAETLNNINTDINQMTSIADSSVFFVITQAFSMTGGIIGLFIIDFRMTVLVLLFIPIKCVVMKYFAKKQKQIMDEFIKRNQEYAKWFGDTVGGVREVKLFNILDKKHEEFVLNQNNIIEKQKQMNMLGQWNTIIDSIMVQFLSTLLYILGANLVFDMKLSVGSVFAFITYSAYVTGPISAILNIGYLLSGIIPSTKRYYTFMELEEETDNGKKTDLCPNDLRLQKVSFVYERDKCILKNIDILFAKSSKTAIIGRNGSGKTTIINLLTRMYEPTSGEILLGAENISELPLPEYRNMVSVVSQQIYLFNDTIRNNICLDKQIDDTVIEAACKDSGLEDFIKEVSLDHVVGQNGAMLSGGQKQKIALARALVHDKPIIIFDEATAMLDPSGRKEVMNVIKKLNKEENITTLHITHYMEEAVQADRVVVVDKGKKLLEGTPKEVFKNVDLLKKIGLDVPYMTELAGLLREEGLDIDDDILTVDEMVDKLCQL